MRKAVSLCSISTRQPVDIIECHLVGGAITREETTFNYRSEFDVNSKVLSVRHPRFRFICGARGI